MGKTSNRRCRGNRNNTIAPSSSFNQSHPSRRCLPPLPVPVTPDDDGNNNHTVVGYPITLDGIGFMLTENGIVPVDARNGGGKVLPMIMEMMEAFLYEYDFRDDSTTNDFVKCARHHLGPWQAQDWCTKEKKDEQRRIEVYTEKEHDVVNNDDGNGGGGGGGGIYPCQLYPNVSRSTIHLDFMRGRKFRVYAAPSSSSGKKSNGNGLQWYYGQVEYWIEWHNTSHQVMRDTFKELFFNDNNDDDDIDKDNDTVVPNPLQWTLVAQMEKGPGIRKVVLDVRKMNVQGGGTVFVSAHNKKQGAEWLDLSLEWMEPFDHGNKGLYYYDPTTTPVSVDMDEMCCEARMLGLDIIMAAKKGFVATGLLEWLQKRFREELDASSPESGENGDFFRRLKATLMSMPFPNFIALFESLLPNTGERDKLEFVVKMLAIGRALRNDHDWMATCSDMNEHWRESGFDTKLSMARSLHSAIPYFESHAEYRSVVWCGRQVLLEELDDVQKCQAHLVIGLAYRRMDDFTSALREFERSLSYGKSNKSLESELELVFMDAKQWVGTTGKLFPFSTLEEQVCFECSTTGAPIVCQDCRIACYCSNECQTLHQAKIHHLTCGKFCPPPPFCPVCSKELANVDETHRKQCNLCRKVHYCSRECRRSHWKHVHRAECPREFSVTTGG